VKKKRLDREGKKDTGGVKVGERIGRKGKGNKED